MKSKTQHLTTSRLTRYEKIILASENVQVKRYLTLNPATLLPDVDRNVDAEAEELNHDCIVVTENSTKPREDIKDNPLENPDLFFVDGSCMSDEQGHLRASYAVYTYLTSSKPLI